jgi:glycosyltransferase involved in cell wall biosynthesis
VRTRHYTFVLEQGLGHTVHSLNIERVLSTCSGVAATLLKVRPGATPGASQLPFVNNWSLQSSWIARDLLMKQLAVEPPDAIFVHTQVAALLIKSVMRRVPTIISLDATPINLDSMAEAYSHRQQRVPLEWAKLQVNRRALLSASAIVTWSPWAARSVVDDYGVASSRVHPIYPGVDLTGFHPHGQPRSPGPARILFVGGDFVRKGGPDLLNAAALLGSCVEIDIVTSSATIDIPSGLTARIHENVPANSPTMKELYARADIFALPTRGDCTPLVIAEAMASGLPVVTTAVGSIPDMVRSGENGLVVEPGDTGQLAQALRSLVEDRASRERMGAESRAIAEREHDATANCHRILSLMDEMASRSSRDLPFAQTTGIAQLRPGAGATAPLDAEPAH